MHEPTPEATSPQHVMTVTEARDFLRVSDTTMWKLIAERELTSIKVGRRRLLRRSDLEAFLAEHVG